MKKRNILIGLFAGACVVVIVVTFYLYQLFYTPNILVDKKQEGLLYIPEKAHIHQVLDSLKKHDYVAKPIPFMFVSRLLKYHENVKPGRYALKPGMTNLEAIRLLRSGRQEAVLLTFNNLRLKREIPEKLAANLALSPQSIDSLLNSPAFCSTLGFDTTTISTLFLPNTYQVYWNTTAEQLLRRMKTEYDKFWNTRRRTLAESIGLRPVQVSILASIVEGETKHNTEKATVAGVYINRLNRNMRLAADPTVVFAIGDFSIRRVLKKHLEYDSPYNTYRHTGLPPGPINIPEMSSIEAVLNYERHKFLYFCAKEDFSGYHAFAKTLREHNQNANRYRRALSIQMRKARQKQK